MRTVEVTRRTGLLEGVPQDENPELLLTLELEDDERLLSVWFELHSSSVGGNGHEEPLNTYRWTATTCKEGG